MAPFRWDHLQPQRLIPGCIGFEMPHDFNTLMTECRFTFRHPVSGEQFCIRDRLDFHRCSQAGELDTLRRLIANVTERWRQLWTSKRPSSPRDAPTRRPPNANASSQKKTPMHLPPMTISEYSRELRQRARGQLYLAQRRRHCASLALQKSQAHRPPQKDHPMTNMPVRIKRNDQWCSVDVDQLTDDEMEDVAAAMPEMGWNWALALAKWIRHNVTLQPGPTP